MIRHILLYKFREDASAETIQALASKFLECEEKLPGVEKVEHGPNVADNRDLSRGFNYCFLMTFKDMTGISEYIASQEHDEIVKLDKPISEGFLVFDMEVEG